VTDRNRASSDAETATLWFGHAPDPDGGRRHALTRDRVVAEALAMISSDGVQALTMRSLAGRLEVVPGALYRHVRSKEQLHDLVLDEILAEVDVRNDPEAPWTEQITTLARRLRLVLEGHPGIAGLLKSRAPLTPHALALAEAFLEPLLAAALPPPRAAMAYHLIHDYTVGFALSDRSSATEQRISDPATRRQLLDFLRSLPADRFPLLSRLGALIWVDDRNEQFDTNLHTLVQGLAPRG
jgi:AcrR family transcriptional regulator